MTVQHLIIFGADGFRGQANYLGLWVAIVA